MNKPFFYNRETSRCPEAKGCGFAKLQFCTLGNGELHENCSAFKGNIARVLPAELGNAAPLTATVEELTSFNKL